MTVTNNSFFIVGPNDDLQKEIQRLKSHHESINENSDVKVEITHKTTEGCSVGSTMYYYRMEIKEKES